MNPSDLIEVDLGNGVHLWWRVRGIYLGGKEQESVVELAPVMQSPNSQRSPTLVPAQLLDACMSPGMTVRKHSAVERTARETELLEQLYAANEALRSCHSVIERRGENTNWEGIGRNVSAVLESQHSTLTPLRLQRIEEANSRFGESPTENQCVGVPRERK